MRIPFLFSVVLFCGALAAQVPQAFNYQAVARNASGDALAGQAIGVRFTLHSGTANGPVAYQEVHTTSTNALGLFTLSVGQGSAVQGSFAGVPWGSAAHFLQVELDATGGTSYTDIGTSQMLSVPYALHAGSMACPTVSLLGDTVHYGNGCYLIQPGMSAANGGCLDLDSDGFDDRPGCGEVDCDDAVASTNPGAVELCGNGVDDDCDGVPDNNTDLGAFVEWHPDTDADGYGDSAITISACSAPPGHVADGTDCDDADVNVFPGQGCSQFCSPAEAAWVDQNQAFLYQQADGLWFNCFNTPDAGACLADQLAVSGLVPLGANCLQCLADRYNCITANCLAQCISGSAACQACIDAAGCDATFLQCMGVADSDGDGWADGSDCGPNDPGVHLNAAEICADGIDNNCNGFVDEGCAAEICDGIDNDGDGLTDAADPSLVLVFCENQNGVCNGAMKTADLCVGGTWLTCATSDYFIGSPVYEPTETACDALDNDCDGQVDEDGVCAPCTDNDLDGFTTCDGDCDDANSDVFPGAAEICGDGSDNDCDGTVDNATTWFEDLDADGFGNPAVSVQACEQPVGFVFLGTDCDDQDPAVFPLAGPGVGCSSCSPSDRQWLDDNYHLLWNTTGTAVSDCQGLTGQAAWDCLRANMQPFAPIAPTCLQCAVERAYTVLNSCSAECIPWLLSNGVVAGSMDCNLCAISSGAHAAFAACTGVVDQDGDGVPASADCNDNDPTSLPGAEDICDGLDNDCDGQVDEDCGQ